MNALAAFLSALVDRGQVLVDGAIPLVDETVSEQLQHIERVVRRNAPHEPPEYCPIAAEWGAMVLYRGCQFLVFRDVDAEVVRRSLAPDPPLSPIPDADDASRQSSRIGIDHAAAAVTYSVDLVLRYLPGLCSLARGAAPGDPLVEELVALGSQWPLSSVGIGGVHPRRLEAIVGDRCLKQMYVDRIIERKDASRLMHPEIRDGVAAALGAHPELCPPMAEALAAFQHETAESS